MSTLLIKNILNNNFIQKIVFIKLSRLASTRTVIFKPKDYLEREKEKKNSECGRIYAIEKLEELLGVRKFSAIELVTKNKKLCEVSGNLMNTNYYLCKDYNIKNTTCIKYTDILAENDLEEKLKLLQELPHDVNITAPLLTINLKTLQRFIKSEKYFLEARINVFRRLLNIKLEDLFEAFAKRPFLRKINLQRIEENIKILRENGITNEEIYKDWWVLQYSIENITQRLEHARENNIEKVKTWMIRGKEEIFVNYVRRRSESKLILGDNTLLEYLAERLDCTTEQAKGLMFKLPALKNKNMKKMQEIFDFLYSEGFKPNHICRVPKILLHSVETTRKRIRELEKQGIKIDSLHMLTKSQKQYMQYYEALVKSNKNKIKNKA